MANAYNGEMDVTLYFKVYPMRVNMGVIAAFQSATGVDFMHVAIKAINSYNESREFESPFKRAMSMTGAVSMEHAARLFYLAAVEIDKTVTFDEIQEAVLLEGPMERVNRDDEDSKKDEEFIRSYPIIFAELVMFAALGVVDTAKKL